MFHWLFGDPTIERREILDGLREPLYRWHQTEPMDADRIQPVRLSDEEGARLADEQYARWKAHNLPSEAAYFAQFSGDDE